MKCKEKGLSVVLRHSTETAGRKSAVPVGVRRTRDRVPISAAGVGSPERWVLLSRAPRTTAGAATRRATARLLGGGRLLPAAPLVLSAEAPRHRQQRLWAGGGGGGGVAELPVPTAALNPHMHANVQTNNKLASKKAREGVSKMCWLWIASNVFILCAVNPQLFQERVMSPSKCDFGNCLTVALKKIGRVGLMCFFFELTFQISPKAS